MSPPMKRKFSTPLLFGLLVLASGGCAKHSMPVVMHDQQVWKKVKLDFSKLDAEGLAGDAPDGKVAMNYEFCIPAEGKRWREVKKIDPTAQKNGGRGRVGCSEMEWLIIGSTHQKNYMRVLHDLAALPFVNKIEETFWE